MAMPDGVEALLRLAAAPASSLTRQVYNVGAFAPSAGEIRGLVVKAFPTANITFEPDLKRQGIVDSWPGDVDDTAARRDWGFAPKYGLEAGFSDYLIPTIRERYRKA
jgi:nucleoside-diphosphate-sugar epimerase